MFIDFTHALQRGLGSDKHDDAQIIAVSNGLIGHFVITEGEIGDDHSINATLHTALTECLETKLHDRVEVAHQDKGNLYIATNVLQLTEEQAERHAVAQGLGSCILNHDTIGHRVAEGDTYLYHIHAVAL